MLHSFAHQLRQEIDTLPLPPEEAWIPSADRRSNSGALWSAAAILVGLAIVALVSSRVGRTEPAAPDTAAATPSALPTCAEPRQRCVGVSPVPNLIRNAQFGYNLVIPGYWRESNRWQKVTQDGGPLSRQTFTARAPDVEAVLMNAYGPTGQLSWDLTVDVWNSGGLTARDWASAHGCGPDCMSTEVTIRGSVLLRTVRTIPCNTTGVACGALHSDYIARGAQMLVLTYLVGSEEERPPGVDPDVLDAAVRSIGLV